MGNGSSSARPTNTVTVQPASSNQTNFSPRSSNHDHINAGFVSPAQNHTAVSININGTTPVEGYGRSSLNSEIETDDFIETAVAPQARVDYGNMYGQGSNSEPTRNSKKKKINKKCKHLNEVAEESVDTNDEIIFEVYRSHYDGGEYTVINNDGVRFYLDSWTTGEWQPFPEEWLNHGYIERQTRNAIGVDCISTSDVMIDDVPSVGMNDDERMGVLQHPLKGELTTYMMEEHCHVHCVFDPSSGAWLKLPLSWELHSPSIAMVVSHIQETFPAWTDQYEILALLRQCNYDVDETITTYLTLLENDLTWRQRHNHSMTKALLEDDVKIINDEVQLLRKKVVDLENIIRGKDIRFEKNQQREKELEEELSSSESMIRTLQNKITCIQSDLEQAQLELENTLYSRTKIPSPQIVPTSLPKKRKVATETVLGVMRSISSLASTTQQLKRYFIKESSEVQALLGKALFGIRRLTSINVDYDNENIELRRLYNKEALHRKLLYNKLQELRGNLRVFCRCRFDPEADIHVAVKFPSDQEIQAKSQLGEKTFMFDRIFTPSSSQQQVFEDTLPLITSCVDGYNVCIMAYGQTGSGKTYTMMGTDSDPGVNIRSIQELLRICKERQNSEYTLTVSMLEVYNETLRDLLGDDSMPFQLNIQLKGNIVVVNNLTEIQVNSEASINKIMAKGNGNRSIGETKMNTNSSRSHLVLTLNIKGVDLISNSVSHGTLTLVDLAGSERISKTEATGQRLIEAAAINKSLSALGQVFTALRTNAMHVPYRNSKLTQLLQAALGGDGKACLFINISPAQSNLNETLSTLNFGSAAKQIQLGKAKQNVKKLPK